MEQQIPENHQLTVIHSRKWWLKLTESWIYNQVRYLPESVKSHIVCEETVNPEWYSLPSIHVFPSIPRRLNLTRYGLPNLCLRRQQAFIVRIAKREGANILHSHYGYEGWKNIKAAQRAGLKHVVTFYGWDVSRLPKCEPVWVDRYRELFEHIDRVLCEGPHMAECLAGSGCAKEKIMVHHLGIPVSEIAFETRVWTPGKPLRVLIAATFKEKKGIPYALEALGKLQSEISLEITIIGDAISREKDQAEKRKILEIIEKSGLKSKVRLLGFQPHSVFMEEAYGHHIFLSPSVTAKDGDTEGGAPVSIIEMVASGMPVVSTRHCDIPGVIQDGVTGLLTDERSVNGLVEHLRWLIDNPCEWATMAQAGRKYVEAEFNAEIQGERLAAIYSELNSNRRDDK